MSAIQQTCGRFNMHLSGLNIYASQSPARDARSCRDESAVHLPRCLDRHVL
jgi:hypothetical protein